MTPQEYAEAPRCPHCGKVLHPGSRAERYAAAVFNGLARALIFLVRA